jgi:hypothetical protein
MIFKIKSKTHVRFSKNKIKVMTFISISMQNLNYLLKKIVYITFIKTYL